MQNLQAAQHTYSFLGKGPIPSQINLETVATERKKIGTFPPYLCTFKTWIFLAALPEHTFIVCGLHGSPFIDLFCLCTIFDFYLPAFMSTAKKGKKVLSCLS